MWNVNGICRKLVDDDFLNYINDYDILLLTETWNARTTNININGYKSFVCPRPRTNTRAKRASGGVIVYYKQWLENKLELVKTDYRGIIWFKLKKDLTNYDSDLYFCTCYIPPENSSVYKNVNSDLFECNFFDMISDDVLVYSEQGKVVICGDTNSRVGIRPDYIDNLHLDRYIDVPFETVNESILGERKSNDLVVNNFGNQLLNLCKDNDLHIVNGRLEDGNFTCHTVNRRIIGSSVVDYVLTNVSNFKYFETFNVQELTEYSDHCPLNFSIRYFDEETSLFENESITYGEKIVWDSNNVDKILKSLSDKRSVFQDICNKLLSNESDIDQCITDFTDSIYDVSFQHFGKRFRTNRSNKNERTKRKVPWFNEECEQAKRTFQRNRHIYKNNRNAINLGNFVTSRNAYAKIKKRAKTKYFASEKDRLSNLSKKNPKEFWKFINRHKTSQEQNNSNISIDEFAKYFASMAENNGQFQEYHDLNIDNGTINIDELDCNFTSEEISKTIKTLKRNKSCGIDNISADFFIDANDFISPYLTTIFNKIYETRTYPEAWRKGIIVPIFKKGERNNPRNYRGITLMSSIAKIFSLCLRNRLNKWCEQNELFNQSQFGFRDKKSTTDCVYILHSIIQKIFASNKKLYCTFIDYERCFDTICRDALWIKLVALGISSKFVDMVKSIYRSVSSCVKLTHNKSISEFFDIAIGLKQGEPLSPLMFILFVNDISSTIDFNNLTEFDINQLSIYLLLFADDIAVFTTDKESLQSLLDNIYTYSNNWGLKINVNKTKVCIFEKRKQRHNFVWTINNEQIEEVEQFCYLGIMFTKNGNLHQAVKSLSEQASKAMHNLLGVFKRIPLDIKTKLALFDRMITPILLYGSEVWGIYNYTEVDKIHITFCKYILGVRKQTSTNAILGDLGRFPLSLLALERSLKYWCRIKQNTNNTVKLIFLENCNFLLKIKTSWVYRVKVQLDTIGFF